jgi:hypothetical protein
MKKQIGVLIFCGTASCFAQSVSPEVVATSGDYFTGSAATLSWTLGEVATDTYFGTSNQLTQGFQQPRASVMGVEDLAPEITMTVYPNPTAAEVNLTIPENEEVLGLSLIDVNGNVFFTSTYAGNSTQKIDLGSYADGLYLLQVTSPTNGLIKTLKIQKN